MPDVNDPNHEPEKFSDLPMQPTGSGPADLEVAYEQMRLAEEGGDFADASSTLTSASGAVPIDDTRDAAESEAHPS